MLDLTSKYFSLNSEQQRKIVVMIGGDKHQVKAFTNRNDTTDDYE